MNVEEEDVFQPAPEDVIQDKMLNWVIRGVTLSQSYKKEDYIPITPGRFEGLRQFTYSAGAHPEAYPIDVYVYKLDGLQYGTDLWKIDLSYNMVSDLSPISKLTNLRDLTFYMNKLTDISALKDLTGLERLNCGQNQIHDLTPLKKMSKLNHLDLDYNGITSLSGLEGCTGLTELTLRSNRIKDISALKGLTNMEKMLWLSDNQITDISALAGMTKLKELDLFNNQISDITPLQDLRNLQELNLGNNKEISDITPLTELTKLTKSKLNLSGTKIETKKNLLFEVLDVNRLIEKFDANTVELSDKSNVVAARKAYDKVSDKAKAYINEKRISVAEKNISLLEQGKVIQKDSDLNKYEKYYDADKSTLNIYVADANRKPLKNVRFQVKKKGSADVLSEISTDGNGIAEYKIPEAVKAITYTISLDEASKFTGYIGDITVEADADGKIIEINGKAVDKASVSRTLQLKNGETLRINKQNLEKVIAQAGNIKENGYTEASYKALTKALTQAKIVNSDDAATQAEINEAEDNLTKAIDGIVKGADYKTVNITLVNDKGKLLSGVKFNITNSWTSSATEMVSDENGVASYTTQGRDYNYYTMTLAEGQNYEGVTIRLEEQNSKITSITLPDGRKQVQTEEDLQVKLVLTEKEKAPVDFTELQKQLLIANRLNKKDYTVESWNAFYPVFEEANNVRKNLNAIQEEVDTAKNNLEAAIAALVKAPTPSPEPTPSPDVKKAVGTVSLAKTSYTYDGKTKKPAVTAKEKNGKKIAESYYSVSYASGCKKVGTYKVKITFKKPYSGSYTKTFKINPRGTSVKSLKASKKKLSVKWSKQSKETSGYQIQYTTDAKFKKSIKTKMVSKNSTTSATLGSLKSKKKYYVRIRTYKKVGSTKYYSGWSTVKKATVK